MPSRQAHPATSPSRPLPEQITGAVDAVVSGAMWLGAGVAPPSLIIPAPDHLPGLTPREHMIADFMARGLSNPQIAEQLYLSTKAVANYVSTVMLKLGADDRTDAARIVRGTP